MAPHKPGRKYSVECHKNCVWLNITNDVGEGVERMLINILDDARCGGGITNTLEDQIKILTISKVI